MDPIRFWFMYWNELFKLLNTHSVVEVRKHERPRAPSSDPRANAPGHDPVGVIGRSSRRRNTHRH